MRMILIAALMAFAYSPAMAALTVKVDSPKKTGAKVVLKLTLKNGFEQKVEGARATAFLLDGQGKVIGQATKWVIGGSSESKLLAPNATTTYNFVIETDKGVESANVTVTRLILEGGKLADVKKGVIIEKEK